MATVIGKTSTRIDELLADVVVGVSVVNKNLLVTTRSGFVSNEGPVGNEDADAGVVARFAASRRGPIKVLALGSSTTAGVGATTTADRYVNQLARAIQASYSSGVENWEPPTRSLTESAASLPTLPGVHVVNGGMSGSTSASYVSSGMLSEIDALNPDVVIHMVGANDYALGVPLATFEQNVRDKIEAISAVAPNAVHVLSDSFARPDVETPVTPWPEYGNRLKAIASSSDAISFVSMNSEWVSAQASSYNPVDPYRLTDWRLGAGGGIHPSDAGHSLLASLMARGLYLGPTLAKSPAEVFDRFQRNVLGSAETGQAWEQQSGLHVPTSGGLSVTTGGNAVLTTNFSDCEVSALLTHNALVVPGVIAKSNDVNTRIGAFLNGPSNRVELYVGTTLLNSTTTVSLTSSREYFLKLIVKGDQVIAELDGVKVLTATLSSGTVSTYSAYTKHGVRCSTANSAVRWRNFAVRPL